MKADMETLPGTCGAMLFKYFGSYYSDYTCRSVILGGAGLACAGFVNTPECKQAYDELKARFNVVYQSSPRRNSNSGRQFFFVVYDGDVRRSSKRL